MKRAISILAAIAFCAGMNATLAADMFSGNWKLNLAKSKFDPGPAPKGPNFSKIEATNDGLKFTNTGVNAEGQPTANEWSGKFDGKDNPVKGDPNRDTAALKKINDNTIEIVNKKDGKVTTTTRAVFSNDGKTRTQTTTGTNTKGEKVNSSVVYEK
ncbi:MAG TPA: hypothetical protein VET45_07110 [Candidatus Binatia bacterium]|jgi:hypothetical protein|nr:hypothetical protein [Candidatus Binatia bacterium]